MLSVYRPGHAAVGQFSGPSPARAAGSRPGRAEHRQWAKVAVGSPVLARLWVHRWPGWSQDER